MRKVPTIAVLDNVALGPGTGRLLPGQPWTSDSPRLVEIGGHSVGLALRKKAQVAPNEPAQWVLDYDERLHCVSNDALWALVASTARALASRGLKPKERILISLDTSLEYIALFLGAQVLGAVPIPAYPPTSLGNLSAWLERLLRMQQACSAVLGAVDHRLFTLLKNTALVSQSFTFVDGHALVQNAWKEADDAAETMEPYPVTPSDLALVQFTSGTTSAPKGVRVTYGALQANVAGIATRCEWQVGDRGVCWLPIYHDMGLVSCVLGPLMYGIPVLLMPPMMFLLRPRRWLWAIHYVQCTQTTAPNFAYAICVSRIREAELSGLDLSTWRVAGNGAEFVHQSTIEEFVARYEPYGFRRGTMLPIYGMAECVVGTSFPPLGRGPLYDCVDSDALEQHNEARPKEPGSGTSVFVSTGTPFDGHEIAIVDPHENHLPERRRGEVLVRGPSVTDGYEGGGATNDSLLRDGWLRTGDLGYLANGELYICGRTKDLIIRAGRNFHPYDLEQSVSAVSGVRKGNVAVFGHSQPDHGTETLVILFETRMAKAAPVAELERRVRAAVFEQWGLRAEHVAALRPGSLPKTSSGKLRRLAAKAQFTEHGFQANRAGSTRRRSVRDAALKAREGLALLRVLGMRGAIHAAWTALHARIKGKT